MSAPETSATLPRDGQPDTLEKIGYGLGDAASNLYWKTFEFFLLYFYTDVFGLPAHSIATMFLITRLWDAINDPIVGYLADRTRTRWGRFRPYLLFMGIPLAVTATAAFTTPPLGESGKLAYAYVTYVLVMMAYTAINTPYGALLGVISPDSTVRTEVATYRFVAAFAGAIFVQSCTLDLVAFLGQGDPARGFSRTIALYSVFAVLLFWITFATTRERVQPRHDRRGTPAADFWFLVSSGSMHQIVILSILVGLGLGWTGARDGWVWLLVGYVIASAVSVSLRWSVRWVRRRGDSTPSSFQQDFQDLLANGPWLVLFVYGLLLLMGAFIRNGVILYYFKYYCDQPDRVSWFLVTGSVASIVGMLAARPLAARFSKSRILMIGNLAAAGLTAAMFPLSPEDVTRMFALHAGASLMMGPTAVLLWAMYADTADYSEWKTHRRATGLVFSAATFSQKLGCSIGAAAAAAILGGIGYLAPVDGVNVTQSETTLLGIRWMISIIPAGFLVAAAVSLWFYTIDADTLRSIERDLLRRPRRD